MKPHPSAQDLAFARFVSFTVAGRKKRRRVAENLRRRVPRRGLRPQDRRQHRGPGRVRHADLAIPRRRSLGQARRERQNQVRRTEELDRKGREGFWRQRRGDHGGVGDRDRLRRFSGLGLCHPRARQPGAQQVPARIFSLRAHRGAEDPGGRRHRAEKHARLLGGRDGADPVHALELSQIRRRLRRKGPPRHLERRRRRDRLDRQLPQRARLEARRALGF